MGRTDVLCVHASRSSMHDEMLIFVCVRTNAVHPGGAQIVLAARAYMHENGTHRCPQRQKLCGVATPDTPGEFTRVGIERVHSMQDSGGHGQPPPVVHSPPGLRSAGWEEDVDPPIKESVAGLKQPNH